jgi:hypothetical protein
MASILKVDTIQDQSGNNIINESSDTITIGASGDTINVVGTLQNNGSAFAQGITMADQWRLTAEVNDGTNADITTNWERVDDSGWGGIGTGLTESSGIFSFPETGVYLINFASRLSVAGSDASAGIRIDITTDNSTYNIGWLGETGNGAAAPIGSMIAFQYIFDVTNITTHKFKFETSSFLAGTSVTGNTSYTRTGFTVIRLGDT